MSEMTLKQVAQHIHERRKLENENLQHILNIEVYQVVGARAAYNDILSFIDSEAGNENKKETEKPNPYKDERPNEND